MKIAHVVCTYPPYYGGMGNVVFQTVSELAKLGHYVEVFTPQFFDKNFVETELPTDKLTESIQNQKKVEDDLNVVAKRLKPVLHSGNAAYIPQVKKELANFDLVHLHYPFYGVANMIRKWKLRNPHIPLVITYHMDNRSPGWLGMYFKYYSNYWMPKILATADLLIGSSFDYIKNSNAADFFKKYPQKWRELPFGVDTERFKPRQKPEALFKKHDLDINIPTLLFVGGMDQAHYFKGIPVLLEAAKLIKKNNFNLQIVLVGEGELKEDFIMRTKILGLADRIKFVGAINDQELPYYYNMADLTILPSINQAEAFGMVLLESYASGVPVIASDLPGVRSVAQEAGIVFPVNDFQALTESIIGYFDEKTDRQFWSQKARQIALDKFSWATITAQLNEYYQQLVS